MSSPLARQIGVASLCLRLSHERGQANRGTNTMSSRRMRIAVNAGRIVAALVGAMQLGLAVCTEAAAQSSNALYAGKQIRMVIASGAGGGYDAYGRALARDIGKYIHGHPSG